MYSACRQLLVVLALSAIALAGETQPPLHVCADPNNLPFSNFQQQGFENKLAEMVGRDLHREIQFIWWPARVRFMEKWLKGETCDLVMAVPSGYRLLETTRPYYRSRYAFVTRRDRNLRLTSLDDPRLRKLRIGVHVIGDEAEVVPPAHELAKRGMLRNIVGYSLYGSHPLSRNPSAELITAVARGDIDAAIAWGPMAGYFAAHSATPLRVSEICSPEASAQYPVAFDISMGVRRKEGRLRQQLNSFIARRGREIRRLLSEYGVPFQSASGEIHGCH